MVTIPQPADLMQTVFDPYLSWAKITEYAGFSSSYKKEEAVYLVAVERLDGDTTNPFKNENGAEYPKVGLRPFVGNETFFVGNAGAIDKVEELASDSRYRVELNMSRYRPVDGASNNLVRYAPTAALGKKVIAVIDYGCPFAHRQFLHAKTQHLTSRVKYFWDQEVSKTAYVPRGFSLDGVWWFPVEGYSYGREMTEPVMSRLIQSCLTDAGELDEDAVYDKCKYDTVNDTYSHGGVVMDMAAGLLNPRNGQADTASEADVIFVQLPKDTVYDTTGGSMSVYIMDALSYILSKCADVDQLVINLSFGATAGPHNGQSLIERAMDDFLKTARDENPFRQIDIVLAAGNHHEANLHANVKLTTNEKKKKLKWQVMPDDCTDSYVELWCENGKANAFTVSLTPPQGKPVITAAYSACATLKAANGGAVAAIIRPSEYNREQDKCLALIALAPTHANAWAQVEHGVWTIDIELTDSSQTEVEIDAWIERDDPMAWEVGQPQSHFVPFDEHASVEQRDATPINKIEPKPVAYFGTNSKISNGAKTIVVGSYIAESLVTDGSGRLKDFDLSAYSGAASKTLHEKRNTWPNYIAPGDQSRELPGILASGNRTGIWCRMNGTSVSTPQISRYLINRGSSSGVAVVKPGLPVGAVLGSMRGKSAARLI
jgi:Subtilase family